VAEDPLLHLIEPARWRAALRDGAVVPGPEGFVHLSRPAQVHLPAARLRLHRPVLLVVDPARLDAPVRDEPGVPDDPDGMVFPHLFGPLPTSAVVAVVPYRPPALPALPAADDAFGRALALYLSIPFRRAAEVRNVPGGIVVVDPDYRWSRDDNRLLLTEPATADEVEATATAVAAEAGWPHRAAALRWPGAHGVAAELGRRRWQVEKLLLMARPAAPLPGGDRAEVVDQTEVHDLWDRSWRRDEVAPEGSIDEVVAQLVGREHRNDLVVAVTDVVVREAGRVVAAAQLRVDGRTAAVESVLTDVEARGRGYGDALLARVVTLAAEAGCDLVVLEADADDWPREWYARRGFRLVGSVWDVVRADMALP
jgi:uncharacterized protein (DUF952 family)/N-acetylglutamate synthase-like GNAT family acetyltransferase